MNTSTRWVLVLCTPIILNTSAFAQQQRSIDMEVTMVSPQDGSNYQGGQQVPFTVSLKNNGPDALVAGDTLFYPLPQGGIGVLILQQGISDGQTATIINSPITFSAVDSSVTTSFCTHVAWDPTGEPAIMVPVTYVDPNPANNEDCNQITINPQATAVERIDENSNQTLALYPNPAASSVMLPLKMDKVEEVMVSVRDLTGREILHKNYGNMNTSSLVLDISPLINGFYLVELKAGNRTSNGKLRVQH